MKLDKKKLKKPSKTLEEWLGIDYKLPRDKNGKPIMGRRPKASRYHYSMEFLGREFCITTDTPLRPSDANLFDQPTTKAGSRGKKGVTKKKQNI